MLAQVQVENNQKIIKQLTGTVCSDSVTVGDMHPVTSNAVAIALNGSIGNIIDLVYPVGSIYWSGVANDPNVIFGGTWVQIKDKFIWAKGDSDTLDGTGGEKTVTLTTSQIPSHRHSFTPSGSVSITTNPTFTGSAKITGANDRGHTHTINSGNTSSSGTTTTAGIRHSGSTGGMSANATGAMRVVDGGHVPNAYSGNISIGSNTFSNNKGMGSDSTSSNYEFRLNVSHTHSLPSSYIYGKTDGESESHYHNYTPSGTISGGTYSFSGTASNTDYKGGGGSHNNMPPYIVKYCWQRTA